MLTFVSIDCMLTRIKIYNNNNKKDFNMEYTYSGTTYRLSSRTEANKLNNVVRKKWLKRVSTIGSPKVTTLDITEIDIRSYHIFRESTGVYYIPKSIFPKSKKPRRDDLKMIIKCAFAEHVEYTADIRNPSYIHYIYSKCKYLEYRNMPETTIDRFDRFKVGKGEKAKNGDVGWRHHGTVTGLTAKKNCPELKRAVKEKQESYRKENLEFIKSLMYGTEYNTRVLSDPFLNYTLEGYGLYNILDEELKTTGLYTLHHALVVNQRSHLKGDREPASVFSNTHYKNLTTQQVSEFLGCIILSMSGHKLIHSTHINDDIEGWFARQRRGEVSWIPYHWTSKKAYRETTEWLIKNIDAYDKEDVLSYKKFIKSLTFTDKQLTVIKDKRSKDVRKNDKDIEEDFFASIVYDDA